MEVMVWFYNHYKDFSPLIQNEGKKGGDDGSEGEENENEEDEKLSDRIFTQKVQFEEKLPTFEEKHSEHIFAEKVQHEDKIPMFEEMYPDDHPGPFADEEAPQYTQVKRVSQIK